jgi:hypothetical protein
MSQNPFDFKIADSDQIRIVFAGYSISRGAGASGYMDGEYLKITMEKKSFIYVEGTDGSLVRSKTQSRVGTATISLLQTSSSNDFLSSMLLTDESVANGAGVGTFVVEDLQGTTKFKALKAWVDGWPEQTFDRTAKERAWTICFQRSNILVGSN